VKVRAVALASERSNAIGTVELECTPHGLMLVHLGVGAFSEDYAPAALTSGTRVLVPWAAFDQATVEGERLFLAFDPVLSPHHRLLLANFSSGRSAEPSAIRRQRAVVRAGAFAFALLGGAVAALLAGRLTGAGPALAIGAAVAGALAVLLVGLLTDRLIAYGGVPPEGVREAFTFELDNYLPALGRAAEPPAKKLKPLTLAELQGFLPRTTFAIVVTLTASGLAALLLARYALDDEPARASDAARERRAAAPDEAEDVPRAPAPPRVRPRPAAPPAASAAVAPAPASAAQGAVALGDPCRCARADSLLWADPIPRLSVLVLKQRVRAGRGAPAHESVRKKYTDVDIAVVNNGSTPIDEVALLVLFYEKERGSERRNQVANRPLFYEGPLLPGQAIKWGTDAEGTEIEVQAPAFGSLAPEGESVAPSDRFAELLVANHRPVRLHAAMMLAYLGDRRAKEGILKLREALREDEAPYLGRLLQATSEVRVCRLNVREDGAGGEVSGCLFNTQAEPRKDLGVKLRGLDAPVVHGDPVGAPPNLLLEQILSVPGEVPAQTGVAFKGRFASGSGAPAAWEAVADRVDLLR
jgi:hypothetical protein